MTLTSRRIAVMVLAALMLAAAVFAGISAASSVHQAHAQVVADAKAKTA